MPDAAIMAVRSWGDAHPETFGGLVLAGGALYVGLLGDALSQLADLRQVVPRTVEIAGFRCRWSYRTLHELQDRIVADHGWFAENGLQWSGVSVDEMNNLVQVMLVKLDERSRRLVVARYGEQVRLTEGQVRTS